MLIYRFRRGVALLVDMNLSTLWCAAIFLSQAFLITLRLLLLFLFMPFYQWRYKTVLFYYLFRWLGVIYLNIIYSMLQSCSQRLTWIICICLWADHRPVYCRAYSGIDIQYEGRLSYLLGSEVSSGCAVMVPFPWLGELMDSAITLWVHKTTWRGCGRK